MGTSQRNTEWSKVSKSFLGYLEGSGKALHTIDSYLQDLKTFESYMRVELRMKKLFLERVGDKALGDYSEYLRGQGLKTNSRRRKLMTIRKLLKYWGKRKKDTADSSRYLIAPGKLERIPVTCQLDLVLDKVRALPAHESWEARNRALLWTLLETGCLVSEISLLRWDHFEQGQLQIPGKVHRKVWISPELTRALGEYQQLLGERRPPAMFCGFHKGGPLSGAISSRGVELLLKDYALKLGLEDLTPRLIRHSVTLTWLRAGIPQSVVKERLGLLSDYAFRVYAPLLLNPTSKPHPGAERLGGE